jgi:tRNA pseudouridine38-40 synthase
VQQNARTVQGELERAISGVCNEAVRVTGAGRTDAGVHASGQVIDFRTASALDGVTIGRGVNALLPEDIAVSALEPAAEDFHARFSATGRTYEYRIRYGRERDPLERRRELHLAGPLDVAAMRDASIHLLGRKDFSSFAAGPGGVRSVRSATWCEPGTGRLRFEVAADAFLRGMVRAIVGTLLWVGRGKIDAVVFERIIAAKDRAMAGPSAPANGLCLIAVEYGGTTERRELDEADE